MEGASAAQVEANGMVDFGLDYLNVERVTKELQLDWMRGNPVLIVRCANADANPEYRSAQLRISGNSDRADLEQSKTLVELLDLQRKQDRQLYPAVVIVGWRGMKDREGNEVQFTKKLCSQFIAMLPDWAFQRIRAFCFRVDNFVGDGMATPDVAQLAGN